LDLTMYNEYERKQAKKVTISIIPYSWMEAYPASCLLKMVASTGMKKINLQMNI
jgi:hypothetical protein